MGWLRDKRERCVACLKPFENHDEYVDHITNLHPKGKPCTKCSGLMQWERQHIGQPSMNLIYVCRECDFIGEMWKYHS